MISLILMSTALFAFELTPVRSLNLNGIKHYDVIDVVKNTDLNAKQADETSNKNDKARTVKYPDEVEYSFSGLKRDFHLKLRKNDLLVRPGAKLIFQKADGSHDLEMNDGLENCYYHGELGDEETSSAAVSTCSDQLDGFIRDSKDVVYGIAPHPEHPTKHVLFKDSDVIRSNESMYRCGINDTDPYEDPQTQSDDQDIGKRSAIAWKYIEVIPVVSYQLYQDFQRAHKVDLSKAIQEQVLKMFNIVDSFYKLLNTRAVVSDIMVWSYSANNIYAYLNPEETLKRFTTYVTKDLFEKGKRYDHATLLGTGQAAQAWGTTIGLAYLGHTCNVDATSINMVWLDKPLYKSADTITHEMGHSVGFKHSEKCGSGACENPPCIMEAKTYGGKAKGFSQCNVNVYKNQLKGGKLPCVLDYPKKFLQPPACGNGFVEAGEQCDCGSAEECKKQGLLDCCDPSNCKLKSHAQCAVGVCCDRCKFKPKSTVCRAKTQPDCDLAEFCTGSSEHCPENTYRHSGTPCAGGTAYCFLDECKTLDEQCKKVWGPTGGNADNLCYDLNTMPQTQKHANCGKNAGGRLISCDQKSKFCGKLMCAQANPYVPMEKFPIIGVKKETRSWKYGGKNCKVVKIEGLKDTPDLTYVETGTKCGDQSVCVQKKCVHINTLVKKNCSPACTGGAICNNKGVCQCPAGAACNSGTSGSSGNSGSGGSGGSSGNTGQGHPCDKANGGCAQICSRSTATAICQCYNGYVLGYNGKSCNKVHKLHPCDTANGGCDHICSRSTASAVCRCYNGYVLKGDGKGCEQETTNYRCVLVPGNGNSGETYAGQFTGDACVKKCTDMKKTLKNINGVVMNNRNCWCELGMTGINNNRNLKTCFLREKEKNGVHPCDNGNGGCAQNCVRTGYTTASCGCRTGYVLESNGITCKQATKTISCVQRAGNGVGGYKIWAGYYSSSNKCLGECLKKKKTNNQINGIIMYQDGSAGCWCEAGMKRISSSRLYKVCFIEVTYGNGKRDEKAVEYIADILEDVLDEVVEDDIFKF